MELAFIRPLNQKKTRDLNSMATAFWGRNKSGYFKHLFIKYYENGLMFSCSDSDMYFRNTYNHFFFKKKLRL